MGPPRRPGEDRRTQRLLHPIVGPLTLAYEVLALADDGDELFVVYTAAPGSELETALRLLVRRPNPGSWRGDELRAGEDPADPAQKVRRPLEVADADRSAATIRPLALAALDPAEHLDLTTVSRA